MSRRAEQMSSVIHRAAQSVLNAGFNDPRLDGLMLTITSVKVTADLRTAIIGVSVMPAERERRAIAGLTSAARHIRREVGELVSVHQLPEFIFKIDKAAKRQAQVLEALAKVRAEEEQRVGPVDEDDASDDTERAHEASREQEQ